MTTTDSASSGDREALPLVVDVDDTLLAGDLLVEGLFRLLSASPFKAFLALFLLLGRGRAGLKRWVAEAAPLDPATLVLNPVIVAEIEAAKAAGRPVWLASGGDELVVGPLAEAIGADGYFASDGTTNLIGEAKAHKLVERFGAFGFDYIGNDADDLPVWQRARRAIGVGLSGRTAAALRKVQPDAPLLPGAAGDWRDWVSALRPHQWSKNVLVFVPILGAHVDRLEAYLQMGGVFLAVCCCASGTYIFNDLFDLPHDRRHGSKRSRPLAAGKVPLLPAAMLGVVLMAAGLAVAFWLSPIAGSGLLAYVGATFGYSLWLKRLIVVDVVVLALLYVLRIGMGATEAAVVSPWLLAFALFLFLALAVVKRQTEIVRGADSSSVGGRGYRTEDSVVLLALGAAAAFASVVVLALYIQSPDVAARYDRPEMLGLVCPLLVYWLGRLLLLANRGIVDDDPVVFALRDRASWVVAGGAACAVLVAI